MYTNPLNFSTFKSFILFQTVIFNPITQSFFVNCLLCEVTADVQGLLIHLSHILQVSQQREAAIVPRGGLGFGTRATYFGCSLETLKVGELEEVLGRNARSDVGAQVRGGRVPLRPAHGGRGQGEDRAVLTNDAGRAALAPGESSI